MKDWSIVRFMLIEIEREVVDDFNTLVDYLWSNNRDNKNIQSLTKEQIRNILDDLIELGLVREDFANGILKLKKDGINFIDSIRDPKVWDITTEVLSGFKGVSWKILQETTENIIREIIINPEIVTSRREIGSFDFDIHALDDKAQ